MNTTNDLVNNWLNTFVNESLDFAGIRHLEDEKEDLKFILNHHDYPEEYHQQIDDAFLRHKNELELLGD